MNSEEKVRAIIISGLRASRSVKEIVKFLNLKRTTVWNIKCRYNTFIAAGGLPEDFSSERKTHSRRSDAMDVNIVASLQELVDQDLGRSMRLLARELGIGEASVRNKMAQDIRYGAGPIHEQRHQGEEASQGQTVVEQAQEASDQWSAHLLLRQEKLFQRSKD
jgi:hypothetical protein